jgi:hypothetical protein
MGIRNWMKILFCIYTLTFDYNHKESLVQVFCKFFLKCILYLNTCL